MENTHTEFNNLLPLLITSVHPRCAFVLRNEQRSLQHGGCVIMNQYVSCFSKNKHIKLNVVFCVSWPTEVKIIAGKHFINRWLKLLVQLWTKIWYPDLGRSLTQWWTSACYCTPLCSINRVSFVFTVSPKKYIYIDIECWKLNSTCTQRSQLFFHSRRGYQGVTLDSKNNSR